MLNCVRTACARAAVAVSLSCAMLTGRDAGAQSTIVLPLGAETTAGTTGNSIPIGNFGSGVYQVLYAAEQMAGVPVGSTITGIQLRQWNSNFTGFPASATVLPKYEVRIGSSTRTPATMSTTFATNFSSVTTGRSGTLSLGAGAYPAGAATAGTPEAWGPMIAFTAGFVYQGGPLVLEFRSENPSSASNFAADVFTAPAQVAAGSNSPSTATTCPSISQNQAVVVRLSFQPAPSVFQKGITRLLIMDDLANIRGNSAGFYPLDEFARTLQTIADTGEMRRLGLGSNFVGLLYRNGITAAWPIGAQSYTKYDITLARGLNTPATMSDTIAANMGADATVVRSGALAIASGAMGALNPSPRPAPWTFEIPFSNPYTYTGGPLFALVRHDGVTDAAGVVAGTLLTDPGFGTRVRARASNVSSSTSTTASIAFSYAAQLWSIDSGTVAPNTRTSVRGPVQLITPLSDSAQTTQFIMSGSELTYIPRGSQITGFSFRGRSAGATPPGMRVFTEYTIDASTATNRPFTASTTFAANEGADKVRVRSGSFVLPVNGLPGGTPVNPWGTMIQFDRAFIYQGGDVCITIRHSGNGVQEAFVDAESDVSISRTISASGSGATVGGLATGGPIVRLAFNPSVVAPSVIDNTPGNDGYSVFHSPSGNVLQGVYAAEQLRGLRIGSVITGMSLRRYSVSAGGSAWPASDTAVGRFDVTLSSSPVAPGAMSDTFASNIGADAIVVKSGPITIPAGAFPYVQSNTRPNENLWFVQFTEPFVYKGGPLSVTIRNNSSAGIGGAFYADVLENNSGAAAGRWSFGVSPDATVHNQASNTGALALRFVFVPKSYCPSDLNNDGLVEDADFVDFLAAYNVLDCASGGMAEGCPSDLNHDRVVDDLDFQVFVLAYNELVCP